MVANVKVRRYTTREVARLVDLPEEQIRSYVRAGVITAGRTDLRPKGRGAGQRLRFDFRDILVLKTARKLISEGLPPARVHSALMALRSQVPADQPLSSVRISVDGGEIVVSDGNVDWEPVTGQGRLQLLSGEREAPAAQPDAAPVARANAVQELKTLAEVVHSKKATDRLSRLVGHVNSADEWFNLGLSLEEDDPDGAYEAYLRALALDPEHVESMINLGRLCSELGEQKRSAAYFRQAVRVDSSHPVAHFNLAVTLHDLGQVEQAIAAYRAALLQDPDFSDAHYNLSMLLEQVGDQQGALRHMDAYRRILEGRV